jgi:hypothetical protein
VVLWGLDAPPHRDALVQCDIPRGCTNRQGGMHHFGTPCGTLTVHRDSVRYPRCVHSGTLWHCEAPRGLSGMCGITWYSPGTLWHCEAPRGAPWWREAVHDGV